MKRKLVLLLLVLICSEIIYGQGLSLDGFRALSLKEKVEYFFNYYKDDHTHSGVSHRAGYIVFYHGNAVIPLIKEKLASASYFQYISEPKDITLTLIAYVMSRLHIYSNSQLSPGRPQYYLPEEDIYWFFDEYMRRIDEYILSKRTIDETVMDSNFDIVSMVYSCYNEDTMAKLGYPFLGEKPIKYCGNVLKQYYEERLGIRGLKVVPPFLE